MELNICLLSLAPFAFQTEPTQKVAAASVKLNGGSGARSHKRCGVRAVEALKMPRLRFPSESRLLPEHLSPRL